MGKLIYDIQSYWHNDIEKPDEIARRFLDNIDSLERIDPTISNWEVGDLTNSTGHSLSKIRSDMTSLVMRNIYTHYDDDRPDSRGGYHVFALSTDAPGQDGNNRSKHISIEAGALWRNRAEFSIGSIASPPDLSLVTYPAYRQALDVMASIWPLPWACARAMQWSDVPSRSWRPPPAGSTKEEWLASMRAVQPPSPIEVPWILYLSAPFLAGLTPPPELTAEPTPGGGVVLSAMLERPDPDNPDHLRRARLLGQIMDQRLGVGDQLVGWGPRTGPY
ncbi:MAG: hypothetical protein P4M09_06950 [Devosia sp.]|nr:hypothetical protein [Devosia sp.]